MTKHLKLNFDAPDSRSVSEKSSQPVAFKFDSIEDSPIVGSRRRRGEPEISHPILFRPNPHAAVPAKAPVSAPASAQAPDAPTLLEKGYVFQLDLIDGDRVEIQPFPRHTWIMLHDPQGMHWPKCDVLFLKGRVKPDRIAVGVTKEAEKYYGDVHVYEQNFKIPSPHDRAWKFAGECAQIMYDRVGDKAFPFYHPFDRSALPRAFNLKIGKKVFWRLTMQKECSINERGYVWP